MYFQIEEEAFLKTIESINSIFDEAEALNCGAYSEGCLFCLTGYTLHFCYKTNYERVCCIKCVLKCEYYCTHTQVTPLMAAYCNNTRLKKFSSMLVVYRQWKR